MMPRLEIRPSVAWVYDELTKREHYQAQLWITSPLSSVQMVFKSQEEYRSKNEAMAYANFAAMLAEREFNVILKSVAAQLLNRLDKYNDEINIGGELLRVQEVPDEKSDTADRS